MSPHGAPPAALFAETRAEPVTPARMGWIIRLRWVAMAGILGGALLTVAGFYPGVNWQVLVATVAAGVVYNLWLWTEKRRGKLRTDRGGALGQAIIDMCLLTVVLWASGGTSSPFIAFYVFHVALIGILAGARATIGAFAAAVLGTALLEVTRLVPALQIGRWDPVPPWDVLAELTAVVTTVGAVAYLVTHAVRELHQRERALALARDRAALEYELLSNTLNELEAGLEVVDEKGDVLWRNKRAEELAPWTHVGAQWECPKGHRPCERDATGLCPVEKAIAQRAPGRCRFATPVDGEERVYEMMVFPLQANDPEQPRIMNLYIDRTHATLAERRLVLAERLASLGRVAQGVAHELNTPLATIRTLAADMRVAVRSLGDEAPDENAMSDLDESAALIQDETRRLGRITQALLAGGDLVRARVDGAVPLSAVVERARALVLAGVRQGPVVEVREGVDHLAVVADPDRLMQVLVNLLQNALDAVRGKPGGQIVVRATRGAGNVELVVEDDGPGIDPAMEGRLFEPFATTKPPGQGTGLGLYTSYMLVRAMGGDLVLERRDEGGTRARVRLGASTLPVTGLADPALLAQRPAE